MEGGFVQISLILLVVLGVSFLLRLLKQPMIMGYIFSGILVGPLVFNLLGDGSTFAIFSQLGISFLLFIVGLSLSPKVIKEVGKISLLTGIGQVIFTSLIGYFICLSLGFNSVTSIYISIALTFSSTIIIMKLLSDKDSLDKLYGKISIGFLLVQDLIAIIILIIVSALSQGGNFYQLISSTLLKGVIILAVFIPLNKYVLPRLNNSFAKSQELLFLFALAWGLGMAGLFSFAGFSLEVGALIAGVMLSYTPYSSEVSAKLKPLRDFFVISFFILLGSQIVFDNFSSLIIPALILSLFVLIGKPLIMMVLMGTSGYSKNTGFMTSLTIAQISEFSLILITVGSQLGHIDKAVLSFVTIIGLITIAGSSYMIIFSERIYPYVSKYLKVFERKMVKEDKNFCKEYEYILLGENRIGFSIMKSFMDLKKPYLIVDYNPIRVAKLSKMKINCVYGDASEENFIDELNLNSTKMIVSTIPEFESNLMLLKKVKQKNKEIILILTARHISEAFKLYQEGADYVIVPHFLGGEYVAKLIREGKDKKEFYSEEKTKQIKDLKERFKDGQEHPEVDRK